MHISRTAVPNIAPRIAPTSCPLEYCVESSKGPVTAPNTTRKWSAGRDHNVKSFTFVGHLEDFERKLASSIEATVKHVCKNDGVVC